MRVFLLWLMGAILAPTLAAAQLARLPETPELAVTITPAETVADGAYVQGQLVMRIQLVSRYPFEALSLVPPEIENAQTVRLLRPRTRRISGYAGQGYLFETALAIIPRQAGVLRIPAVTAVGSIEPRKDEEVGFDLASEPVEVTVSGIPDAYGDEWWLVAPRVEIDESWSVPVTEIRVGESVERRVSLRVWGASAERLPTLTHPATQGVGVSLRSAKTRTETTPDGLIAHADFVWDFTVRQQQVIFVRPIGVAYWDPSERRRKAVAVPGHRLEPLPADSAATAAALMREAEDARDRTHTLAWAAALGLALPCLALAAIFAVACWPSRADRRLWKTCGEDAAPEALYRAVDAWAAESGLEAGGMTGNIPARARLSDRLFAPGHPPEDVRRALGKQALRWSRRARLSATKRRLFAGATTRNIA